MVKEAETREAENIYFLSLYYLIEKLFLDWIIVSHFGSQETRRNISASAIFLPESREFFFVSPPRSLQLRFYV